MNTGDFISTLLQGAGVSKDDAALVELTNKLNSIEISDEFVNKVNQGYFTEAAAKANPRIIGHFKAQLYNGLDDELKPLYDELEIGDEVKSELFAINSSTKRASALVRKVKELESKKASASTGDKKELTAQIEALNNQIREEKKQKEAEILKAKLDFDSKLEDLYLSQFLSTQNYASDGYKDEDFLLPKTKIQKALKEKGLVAKLENKAFKLMTEQGTDFYDNNTKVEYKSFAEKVLADNKLTTISEPSNTSNTQPQIVLGGIPNNKSKGLAAFDERIQQVSTQTHL